MMHSIYTGAMGMKTHSAGLQVISNNLANVNTVGYKQQSALFQELMSENLALGTSSQVVSSQLGFGSQVGAVRTNFKDGAYEPGSAITDLAIGGKGFFQVVDGDATHYTRAGNFRFDKDGYLKDPAQFTLSGIPIINGVESGNLQPIRVDVGDPAIAADPYKSTSTLTAIMNIGTSKLDKTVNEENPFFAMFETYDATQKPPIPNAGYTQSVPYYDSAGEYQNLTMYFDKATSVSGQTTMEYVVAMPPSQDGRPNAAGTPGAGLLMSGTITFSSSGEMLNMTAFTPGGGDLKDLTNWTPAPLAQPMKEGDLNKVTGVGLPEFTLQKPGQPPQTISLNFGMQSTTGWQNAPASAADIGANHLLLPTMGNPQYDSSKTSAMAGSSALKQNRQDGYGEGQLSDLNIDTSGIVRATYTNGQSRDIYRIPVFRMTSEDGLRREGSNHYSATPDTGVIENGQAGTENYGKIYSTKLELSNVDVSQEMVNMIINQRGFQSNSKTITTADAMLQKAMELKRN